MKERIFTTKEQGRALVEAGLPISTASGYRSSEIDRLYGINKLYSMEDNAGRVSLTEAVTPDGRDVVVPGKWHGKFPKEKATEEQLKKVGYKNMIR